MAHECPSCGSMCYCNGDIDDCLIPSRKAEAQCECCACRTCGYDPEDCVCPCLVCGERPHRCVCGEEYP